MPRVLFREEVERAPARAVRVRQAVPPPCLGVVHVRRPPGRHADGDGAGVAVAAVALATALVASAAPHSPFRHHVRLQPALGQGHRSRPNAVPGIKPRKKCQIYYLL